MDVMFPSYLSEVQYEFRHLKIIVKKNTLDMSNPSAVLDHLTEQAKEVGKVFASAAAEITDIDAKLLLDSANTVSQSVQQALDSNISEIHSITLPLPNELTDQHSHDWATERGVVGSIAESIYNGSPLAKGVSILADTASMRKPLADPGYFQNYNGTQPRTFNMSFDLIPNNVTEAETIITIITMLRKFSLPTSTADHALMLAPYFFDIEMSNKHIDGMMNIKGVVISSISVNYSGDGNMQQTADGIPKHIKLDLTFIERRMSMANYYPDFKEGVN